MATEKILNTRIQLKYDSYINWETNNPTLKPGEVAIAYLALSNTATTPDNNTHPVMFKVGPGEFNSLPWVSALAADVHDWAKKSESDFTTWVKSLIDVSDIDAYSKTETDNLLAEKVDNSTFETYKTTNDAAVKKVADDLAAEVEVARAAEKANADAITAMKDHASVDSFADVMAEIAKKQDTIPANTYDAYGAAAQALTDAKAYADGKDAAIQAAQKAGDDAAAAAAVADGKAVAAQGEVDALEAYVGTFTHDTAKSVVEYINAKTDGIATSGNLEALGARVTTVEGKVATIEGDYLKAADKTELEGKITAVETAVSTEKSRAEGVEGGLETRLKAVEDDYLKAADKTELQDNIDTVAGAVERLTNGVSVEEIDGVNDLIQYVKDHGTEVTGMKDDIAENTSAIVGFTERMVTAEDKITALEDDSVRYAQKTYVDKQVKALEGVDAGFESRIASLEGKFGEGDDSVADMIATAKQEAIDAAAGDATTKANTAESNAKAHADGLNTAMNTRVEALEAIDHDHANKAELDLIASGDKAKWDAKVDAVTAAANSGLKATRTGNDITIEIDDSIVFVFDCGDASVTA